MQLETFSYSSSTGWSVEPLPAMDSERTLVIVFGASKFVDDPAPIRALQKTYARSHVIGCSTSGEILGSSLSDDSLSVAVARFGRVELKHAEATVAHADDSFKAGQKLALGLTKADLKAILVLSDGLNVNGSELVKGFNSVLPETVVVTGGLAGDGDRFKRTWVIAADGPRSGIVSAVGLYGDSVRIGHGSKGGWDIFGPERVVTRSNNNVLYELDGKPALQLYKEYLGERACGLPATALLFPLALRAHRDDEKTLVRTVLSVDEATQSLTFAGNISRGSLAQLMHANVERLIQGASDAALKTRTAHEGHKAPLPHIHRSARTAHSVHGTRAPHAVGSTQPHHTDRSTSTSLTELGLRASSTDRGSHTSPADHGSQASLNDRGSHAPPIDHVAHTSPADCNAHTSRTEDGTPTRRSAGAHHPPRPGDSTPTLSIAISCVGRRLVLGERTEEEIEAVLRELPRSTRQVGFYSYGEISPHTSGHCDLHNQTMTLTTISEA